MVRFIEYQIVGGDLGCWAALNGLKRVEESGEFLMSSIHNETPSIVFTLGSRTQDLQPPGKEVCLMMLYEAQSMHWVARL